MLMLYLGYFCQLTKTHLLSLSNNKLVNLKNLRQTMETPSEPTEVSPSPEEIDQLHRSVKTFKRGPVDLDDDCYEPMMADEEFAASEPVENCWSHMTFAEKLHQQPTKPPLHIGGMKSMNLMMPEYPFWKSCTCLHLTLLVPPFMDRLSISLLTSTKSPRNLGSGL